MNSFILAPSILAANMAILGEECQQVIKAGADWIHFDVMDNHFVPNLTLGPDVCRALRSYGIKAPIDVHLMTKPVDDLIIKFAQAGATRISIHAESTLHLDRSLNLIKDNGCKAGIALNPTTTIDCIRHCHQLIDLIMVMTVNPGFGGQKLIPSMLEKIVEIKQKYPQHILQVDGGVVTANIGELAKAGATCFVAGSAIFNQTDKTKAIQNLKTKLSQST